MNRPNRKQIEQELIDANRMYYGSTIEDEYHKRLKKYVDYLESKAENLAIAGVSQQRELLAAFQKDYNKRNFEDSQIADQDIELFLAAYSG